MIKSTKDYSIFKKHESNRDICKYNLKRIINSIKARNLLPVKPILINPKYEIIDGQHRLEAAKLLNLDIFFEVSEDLTDEDMVLLNNYQKNWSYTDYVNFYCSKENKEYINLVNFMKDNNLNFTEALSIFGFTGGSNLRLFREGKFKFPSDLSIATERISYLRDIVQLLEPRLKGYKLFLKSSNFSRSFFLFLSLPNVSYVEFRNKVDLCSGLVHRCATCHEYLEMFHHIYNYKRKKLKLD